MSKVFIGDEHCRGKFLKIYNQIKDDSSIDFIGCAGDYFSPYTSYEWEDQMNNYLGIIQAAKNDSRIHLLFGNHDMMYLHSGHGKSRYDYEHSWKIRDLFLTDIDMFSIAIEIPELNAVFSHAGISQEWINLYNRRMGHDFNDVQELNDTLHSLKTGERFIQKHYAGESEDGSPITVENEVWKWNPDIEYKLRYLYQFTDAFWDTYGEATDNSPVWIRPNGLKASFPDKWSIQIVGHTKCHKDSLAYTLDLIKDVYGPEDDEPLEIWVNGTPDKKIIMVDTDDALTYWKTE